MSEPERDHAKEILEYLRRRRAGYPHFDAAPSDRFLREVAEGRYPVRSHPFYPALGRTLVQRRFPRSGVDPRKERAIRYAAKKDRILFSFYRFLLSKHYERWLEFFSLSDHVLAYRNVGSNIDHAISFFQKIEDLAPCYVLCLDIKGFFDNISHHKLITSVEYLYNFANGQSLPHDVRYVIERVRKCPYIEEDSLSEYLDRARKARKSQIFPPRTFRVLLESGEITIHEEEEEKGVPQGLPLSDLLSNIHLMAFDMSMVQLANRGWYGRYADDIAIIIPASDTKDNKVVERLQETVNYLLKSVDPALDINHEKSESFFIERQTQVKCLSNGNKNKIQYLGFEWNGSEILIRDSTIARTYRKAKRIAYSVARSCRDNKIQRERAREIVLRRINEKIGKVESWQIKEQRDGGVSYANWTFYSYAKLAENKITKVKGKESARGIRRQIQNLHRNLRRIAEETVEAAYGRKG